VATTELLPRPAAAAPPRWSDAELSVLAWIGEQGAVRRDVLRVLLGRGVAVSDRVARQRVERWRDAGLVEERRFLADQPPVAWLTTPGLRRVGCRDRYQSKPPSVRCLAHLHAVSVVRLGVEAAGGRRWVSERALLQRRRGPDAHVADGRFHSPAGTETAVEVELTRKGPARLRAIVDELTVEHDAVLYVVDGVGVRAGIERAVDALGEHDRVTIVELSGFARAIPPSR